MRNVEENQIVMKTKAFALRTIRLYQYLCNEKNERVLSRQVLRCGTSIGANVKEALRGQSRADFIAKMNIALKEASETEYWLELLEETDYIAREHAEGILSDCVELIKLLTSIIKTTKENADKL